MSERGMEQIVASLEPERLEEFAADLIVDRDEMQAALREWSRRFLNEAIIRLVRRQP